MTKEEKRAYNRDAQRRFRERQRKGRKPRVYTQELDLPADIAWNPRILEHTDNWDDPKSMEA
jgi:hypothetical protein